MLKKFVIADGLAQGLSLTPLNAAQATSSAGLWLLLYGYALRLYFDFGGYTDIAIGLGMLFGIRLPENFNRPYLRTNITKFWQSWHITLSNWARFYVFSPLSRAPAAPQTTAVDHIHRPASPNWRRWSSSACGTASAGTFSSGACGTGWACSSHKQWSDRTRKWYRGLKEKPAQNRAWTAVSWFLTFQFVVLGWVWFLMPDVSPGLGRRWGGSSGWAGEMRESNSGPSTGATPCASLGKAALLFMLLEPALRRLLAGGSPGVSFRSTTGCCAAASGCPTAKIRAESYNLSLYNVPAMLASHVLPARKASR